MVRSKKLGAQKEPPKFALGKHVISTTTAECEGGICLESDYDPVDALLPRVTILRARGKRMVKVLTANGGKRSYDHAAEFEVERRKVTDFESLAALLFELEKRRDSCIIRGVPGRHCPETGRVYRLSNMQPGYVDDAGRRVSQDTIAARRWQDRIGVDLYPVCWLPMFTDFGTSTAALTEA